MKKIKKILAMVLAMAMVLGMSMTTFAAETINVDAVKGKSITIKNVPEGITVKGEEGKTEAQVTYAQIIVADRQSTEGWKFADTAYEAAFVKAFLDKDTYAKDDVAAVIKRLIVLGELENINNTNVSAGSINTEKDADNFSKALNAIKGSITTSVTGGVITTDTIGLYAINMNADGYTFVPMAVYVGTSFTGVEITAKGSRDQVQKQITVQENVNNTSVSDGDVVPFTIEDMYPFFDQEAVDKIYTLSDTVTGGKIDASSIMVKIGDAVVYTSTEKGTVCTVDTTDNSFTIEFAYNASYTGQQVTVTYNVTVGDGSELRNTVTSNKNGNSTQSIVISPKINAEVTKVDATSGDKLDTATFALYVQTTKENTDYVLVQEGENYHIVKKADLGDQTASSNLELVKADVKTTDGVAKFTELDADKTYWVVETNAPAGYSLNDNAEKLSEVKITKGEPHLYKKGEEWNGITLQVPTYVTENTVPTDTATNALAISTATVSDTTLSSLPSTGGIGTTIFTIGGCAIMILAAALYFMTRRKSAK